MLTEPRRGSFGPSGGTYGDGSHRNFARFFSACARSAGVKSIRSFSPTKVREYGGGLVGMGCVGEVFSVGMLVCGTATSGIGQIGCPVMRSNTYSQPCLLGCAISLRGRPSMVASTSNDADELS